MLKCSGGANATAVLVILLQAIVSMGSPQPRDDSEGLQVGISVQTKPRLGLRVVSGSLVYEEHLYRGGLRTRYWSPNGLIKPDVFLEGEVSTDFTGDEVPSLDDPIACSFGLSVDGQD